MRVSVFPRLPLIGVHPDRVACRDCDHRSPRVTAAAGCATGARAARRTQCRNNLKQIGLAFHNYHDVHNQFPIGYLSRIEVGTGTVTPLPGSMSWPCAILPYIDQANAYGQITTVGGLLDDVGAAAGGSLVAQKSVIPGFICPSTPRSSNVVVGGGASNPNIPAVGIKSTNTMTSGAMDYITIINFTSGSGVYTAWNAANPGNGGSTGAMGKVWPRSLRVVL